MTVQLQPGELLGVGGMGRVYALDRDDRMHTRLALKLLGDGFVGNEQMAERLRTEGAIGRQIRHRNVVRVLDHGDLPNGDPYLVMERVDGIPLGELIRREGALPLTRVRAIGMQLLAGVHAIHLAGFVHGDLKSDNILVDPSDDRVTIIDLGLAHPHLGERPGVANDRVSGTPDYMAPEVVLGSATTVKSDIYALAVVFYEMVTGATPFGGGPSERILERHLSDAVVPPTLRCPGTTIPPAFETLVMRALAKDPNERPHDVGMMATAVGRALRGRPLEQKAPRKHHHDNRAGASAPTRDWDVPRARGSRPRMIAVSESPAIRKLRDALHASLKTADTSATAAAYLELAHALVDERRFDCALAELEQASLWAERHANVDTRWPLQLSLAAIYDGAGERVRAVHAARAARDLALEANSEIGCRRAEFLVRRLSGRRAA